MDKDFDFDDPENDEFLDDVSDENDKTHPANDEFGPSYIHGLNQDMGK